MRCATCRFDSSLWSAGDLARTWRDLPHLVDALCEEAPFDVLDELAQLLGPVLDERSPGSDVDRVHAAMHALADAGRLRHRLGAGARTVTGRVVQVSTSGGGVPKQAVARARVTAAGVEGDRQGNRTHHGRPWQAVCLWSAEVIAGLRAEGHPIGWGSAGENLTVEGLDWAALRPGTRLLAGSALLELTAYAIPCRKNARWFRDGRFRRIAQEVAPGAARLYARVVVDGAVAAGDEVVVEPALVPQQPAPDVQLTLLSTADTGA